MCNLKCTVKALLAIPVFNILQSAAQWEFLFLQINSFEALYHLDFAHQHILYLTAKKKWLDCCHTAYQCGCDNDAWDHHNEWKPYHTDRTCVVSLQCAWKHAVTAQLVSWRLYHSLQLHTYGASLLDALGDEPYRDQKMKTRDHAGYIQVMGFSLHSRTLSTSPRMFIP